MEIRVTAPNRIDLAGGTTDIYPLCLFMDGGYTVNAGITVNSTVTLRTHDDSSIRIVSQDLVETQEACAADRLSTDGPLGLIARAVKAFPPAKGLEVITRNEAPAGSGLGASSALLVATLAGPSGLVVGNLLVNGEPRRTLSIWPPTWKPRQSGSPQASRTT